VGNRQLMWGLLPDGVPGAPTTGYGKLNFLRIDVRLFATVTLDMMLSANQNTAVTLVKLIPALALLTLIVGLIRIPYIFRARAMRSLAVRWGFQYVGPTFSGWRASSSPPHQAALPLSFPHWLIHARRIRQVWNVIEGQQSGLSVLIFDSIIGEGRGRYCTFFACQTEQNPFGLDIAPDRVIESHGWAVLFRVRFLQIPWTMGIQRLDDHLSKLRVGSL
jgi:hypothetical protein